MQNDTRDVLFGGVPPANLSWARLRATSVRQRVKPHFENDVDRLYGIS